MKSIAFSLLFFSFLQSSGQHVFFRSFSYEQGLNTYNIQVIKKDHFGFAWIGTQDGVYRYNGKDFQVIKRVPGKPNSLSGNFIFDLAPNLRGQIFVASFMGGIDAIDCQTLEVKHIVTKQNLLKSGLPGLWVKKLYCDRLNNLWVGGKDFLAVLPPGKEKFILLKEKSLPVSLNVNCIVPINDSILCIGMEKNGMLLFNINNFSSRLFSNPWGEDVSNGVNVNDVFVDGQTIWVAGTNTITPARLVNQAWLTGAPITLPAAMKEPIRNIVKDSTGAIWCGTSDGLIRISRMQLSGQSSISPDSMQYFKGNSVNHLFLDPQQNLWVGTTKMMHVSRVGKFPFRAFTGKGNGDAMDHIYSLVPLTDNKIFATGTNGLYITSTNSGITTRVKGTESLGINHHITSIGQGNWLLSTDGGMYIWNEQKGLQHTTTLLRLYPEWKPFVRNYFNNSVLRDSFMYWVSEENEGVLKWDMRKHTIRQFKAGTSHNAGLPENHFHNLAFDREGRLWLMGDEALTVMDTRRDTVVQVIRESKTGPNSSMFFAMYDDGKVIWFGTFGGGLNGFDKQKLSWTFITEKEGLCNNVVYGILPENESCFWVSTNKGISRVNKQTLECINYYKEDGLQDNGFDEKGALQSGGFLYFGGINGFTRVNTADTALRQQSFPVFIYQISYTLNGQNYTINKLSWDKIQFKPGTVNINIRLAALRFPESNKIRLDYSLETEGLSRQPVEESNIITLSSLKPGNAVLHIGVRDEMDTYHEDAFKMRLFMEPFWYQTWLFWGSLVVAICLLLWGLYKHRINLIEHDHRMRREIASDLHDEIGSTLNSVKVFAKLAETAKEKQPLFEQINFSLKQASAGLRDIIWVLDDKKDNLEELFMRLQQFALPVGNVSGIQIEFICADRPAEISLSKSEKKNLYLICKEAVNNSFKYAYCTAIRIEFFREQGKRILAITDNGKGFSEASAVAGNGLQNMRARAEQSGYKIVIGYPADGGTCIRLMQK